MMLSRTGLAAWLTASAALALLGPTTPRLVDDLSSASFPTALSALVELALLVVATWTAVTLGLCMLGGGAAAAHLVPRALRGVLLAGVATSLSLGAAHAGTGAAPDHPSAPGAGLDRLVLPDRPVSASPAEPAASARGGPGEEDAAEVVLVAPGDTLWSIAQKSLDPRADAAEVAQETHRWYAANRDVIGDDPDLLHPGQPLVAPQGGAA